MLRTSLLGLLLTASAAAAQDALDDDVRLMEELLSGQALEPDVLRPPGRYVATRDSESGVWIVNTETGEVRFCIGLSGPDWDMSAECSEWK